MILFKKREAKNHTKNIKQIANATLQKFFKMKDFLELINDIWDFLKVRKKYWLAPLIITLILMGALIIFTQGSVVAPFIYSIF